MSWLVAVFAVAVVVVVGAAWAVVRTLRARRAVPVTQAAQVESSGTASDSRFDDPAGAAPVPGAMLGRFRIDSELGHGAMGTVYLAHDPQSDRPVAIKTMALAREFSGQDLADARDRFFREAEMAGRLRHPDIVAIHDAGEAQGLAFIAMEYAGGHDLLRHTAPGRLLPVETVVAVVARVARALAHAHRQAVVHRDVKPANVIVDVDAGTVKVTDFGIARITDASRTRTGLMLGTPAFMSPEQLAGARLDGRTDLYSLGVMAFQLLAGELPHPADSMAKLMYQIANEPAPDLRTLRPELPEALARAVARALEKAPERRHADGDEMAAELEAAGPFDAAPPPVAGAHPEVRAGRPESGPFEATVPLPRPDPMHNADD